MNFMLLHTVIFLLLFGSGKVESKSRNRTKSHDSTKSLKRSQKLKKEEPEIVKILVLLPEDERFLFREGLKILSLNDLICDPPIASQLNPNDLIPSNQIVSFHPVPSSNRPV